MTLQQWTTIQGKLYQKFVFQEYHLGILKSSRTQCRYKFWNINNTFYVTYTHIRRTENLVRNIKFSVVTFQGTELIITDTCRNILSVVEIGIFSLSDRCWHRISERKHIGLGVGGWPLIFSLLLPIQCTMTKQKRPVWCPYEVG